MVDSKLGPGGRFIRLIESERNWLAKVAGSGVFGLCIAARVVWRYGNAFSISQQLFMLFGIPVGLMLCVCPLVRADIVRHRMRAGGVVGPFSRLLFGAGIWSFLIWVVVVLLIGFPLAIWLGNMTAQRPAG
jgi:hypothetical protein